MRSNKLVLIILILNKLLLFQLKDVTLLFVWIFRVYSILHFIVKIIIKIVIIVKTIFLQRQYLYSFVKF